MNYRIPYIYKGTPRHVESKHKGDFKLLKVVHNMRKSSTSQMEYYTNILNYMKQELNKNKHFVEYSTHLQ